MEENNPLASNQSFASAPLVVKKKTSGFKKFIRTFFLIVLLTGIFLVYWFFYNSYSKGERTGILIKISHKGNVFKTNEGEMWLSCRQMTNPEKFYFSVTNDSVNTLFKKLQDQCIQVTYTQYRASLPWRGDTKYIVTGVVTVEKDN